MGDDLAKVVLTTVYDKAARALDKHRFVFLLGEPASGKTTIAAMLTMAALDNWNASSMKLDEPSDVVQHWSPSEPSQLFWIDDAFGVTQYEPDLVFAWNRIFAKVTAMLASGGRIIMTSRDYIYRRARHDLKQGSFPLLRESQVVIDAGDLTLTEKRQILYNHIKLGTQPTSARRKLKPHLDNIAKHDRFIPEIARRLGNSVFTKNLRISNAPLMEFVERQQEFLIEVIQNLDHDSRAALALIFMRNGSLESPVALSQPEEVALKRLNSQLGGVTQALEALKDSLIRYEVDQSKGFWKFRHPTIGDAFGVLVLRHPELLEVYVRGAPVDELLRQVTCGDVGIEQAVIVPSGLYETVIERLSELKPDVTDAQVWLYRVSHDTFLAQRCDRAFLKLYIARRPEIPHRPYDPRRPLIAV